MRRLTDGLRRWFPVPTPFVGTILASCVAVHILVLVLRETAPETLYRMLDTFALTPAFVLRRPWTLVTMAFLHSPKSLFHLLFNMIALASIGPWLERVLKTRRFALLYIISMLCGSVVFCAWAMLFGHPLIPALGASGAIMGIIVGFGFVFPQAELRFFGVVPFKAKNIIWVAIGTDALAVLFQADIAVAVHAGGMFGAWLYLRRPWNRRYRAWLKIKIGNNVGRLKLRINGLKLKYRLWKVRRS